MGVPLLHVFFRNRGDIIRCTALQSSLSPRRPTDVHAFTKALNSETIQVEFKVSERLFPPGLYPRIADQNVVSHRRCLECRVHHLSVSDFKRHVHLIQAVTVNIE